MESNVFDRLAAEIDAGPGDSLAPLCPEGLARVERDAAVFIGVLKHVAVGSRTLAVLFELDDYSLGQSLGMPLLLMAGDHIDSLGSTDQYFSDTHRDWDLMVAVKERIPDEVGLLPVVRAVERLKVMAGHTQDDVRTTCAEALRYYTERRMRASGVLS